LGEGGNGSGTDSVNPSDSNFDLLLPRYADKVSLDMIGATDKISHFLDRCRFRLIGFELVSGGALIVSGLIGLLLAVFLGLLIFEEPNWLRWIARLGFVSGALTILVFYGYLPFKRWRNQTRVAREIESRLIRMPSDFVIKELELVSVVQFETRKSKGVSSELVSAHADNVYRILSKYTPQELVSAKRTSWPLALFFMSLFLLVLINALASSSLARTLDFVWRDQSASLVLDGIRQPSWIGDIDLVYHYPDYTGREKKKVAGSDGKIMALPGTQVEISARADRNIENATLEVDSQAIPLKIDGGKQLSGELVVMKPGSYRFKLEDEQANILEENPPRTIGVEKDRPPVVRLLSPEQDKIVQKNAAIDIAYRARDDFGVQEIRLVYRISNQIGTQQSKLLEKLPAATRKLGLRKYRWELAMLDLAPGETVQFYIEADDNDSVSGPKVGRSTTRGIKVFSAVEHHEKLMGLVRQYWELLLTGLANSLKLQTEKDIKSKHSKDLYEQAAVTRQQGFDLFVKLTKDEIASKPLVQAIDNINRGLGRMQDRLENIVNLTHSQKVISAYLLRMLRAHLGSRVPRLERDVLYLEDLIDLARLDDLDQIARELEAARQRLKQLLDQYTRAPSEEVRRQIEAEIARLKEKVARLMARQREVLKGIRDEYLNPEALAKMMSENDLMGSLDKIQKLMNEGNTDQIQKELSKLDRQLQQLQAEILRSRAKFGQDKYAELAQQFMKVQSELNAISEAQQKAKSQTNEIKKRFLDRLEKRSAQKLKNLFAKLSKKLNEVNQQLGDIPVRGLDNYTREDLQNSLQKSKLLKMLLDAVDVAGSLDAARDLVYEVDSFQRSLSYLARVQQSKAKRKKIEAARDKVGKALKGAEYILEQLEKVIPSPQKLLGKKDLQKLSKLSEQQSQLRQKLEGLKKQMQKINKSAPIFGEDAMGRLDRSGSAMQRASSELGRRRPSKAHPHQQVAAEELEGLKKMIKKSCKGGGSGGIPLPIGESAGQGSGMNDGGFGGKVQEKQVELPGPEDSQSSKEFRKALLEGMKDPVPQDYRQQVKKYYEELVK
jgi:hypothetical protein